MIVGHSSTGRIWGHQGVYFMIDFLLGLRGHRVAPDCDDVPMDTIPVDYVALVIDYSTRASKLNGQIIHQCSGAHAWRIGRILDAARALLRERGVETPSVDRLPLGSFEEHLAGLRARGSRLYEALLQFHLFCQDRMEFDNQSATALLEPEGIVLPPVERYFDCVLSRYWNDRRAALEHV